MRTVGKSYWMCVSTDTDRDKANVLSWLSPLCDGMKVESAEIMCDVATDREKKIKVIVVDEKGKRRIAIRSKTKGGWSITLKAAA